MSAKHASSIRFLFFFVFALIEQNVIAQQKTPIDQTTCNTAKGCWMVDADLGPMVTYKPSTEPNMVDIEMSVKNKEYVALGFSKDDRMGKDFVVWCSTRSGEVRSGVNPSGKSPTLALNNVKQTSNVEIATVDGELVCRFKLNLENINIQQVDFTSLNASLYFLLASGRTPDGMVTYHDSRTASGAMINIGEQKFSAIAAKSEFLSPEVKANLKKAHGSLMIFAWMFCMAISILMARYFKPMYPNTKPFKKPVWFVVHQFLNIFGILCTVAAFVMIFVAEGGEWAGPTPSEVGNSTWTSDNGKVHSLLGLICSILGFLQPINALFRCHPGTPKRPIFNWIHRGIGFTAWVFSGATIYFFTNFNWMTMKHDEDPKCTLIFYWVAVGVIVILLEVHVTLTERIKNSVKQRDVPMQPLNGETPHAPPPSPPAVLKWAMVRTVLLVVYLLMAAAVVATLIYFICG